MGLFFACPTMVQQLRVTYRRRHCYNTKSNKIKLVKTPGGKLTVHYRTKSAKGPRCGDCGIVLPGIAHLRPKEYSRIPKSQKSVSRAYGGSRCGTCVRQRILRALLVEEQREAKTNALAAAAAERREKAKQAKVAPKATGKKARK